MDHFFTIDKPAVAEFKDRGSTFIAYAFHIETANDFKHHLKQLKKQIPKLCIIVLLIVLVWMEIISE